MKRRTEKTNLVKNIVYSFKSIWGFKRIYIILMFSTVILFLIGKTLSMYTAPIIIEVVEKNLNVNIILKTIIIIVLFNFVYHSLDSVLSQKINTEYRTKYEFYMKDEIMKKCMRMRYDLLEDPDVVTMKDRAYSAALSTFNLMSNLCHMLSQLLAFLFFGGVLTTLHPLLIVVLVVSSLVYLRIMRGVRDYQHKQKDNVIKINRKLNYVKKISSNFGYAKEVRLFNLHIWLKTLSKTFFTEYYDLQSTIQRKSIGAEITNCLITYARDLGAYVYLIHQIVAENLSISQFVLYFSSITLMSNTIIAFVESYNRLKTSSLNIDDYRIFLSYPQIENDACRWIDNEKGFAIELVNVSFKYPKSENYILEDINLTINSNEKLAIVGANGAGKTTLVKLICGLYQPTEGQILINGIPLNEYRDYIEKVSVVFQFSEFLPLSIAENIGISDIECLDNDKVINCLKLAGAWSRIADLHNGINTKMCKDIYEDAAEFSGGELQKLILARAIYKKANLLILDEPTSALDPIAENEIYLKYHRLTNNQTSVYISHRLASTRFCDRIALIADGKILELGSHEELMNKNGAYAKIFATQSYYYKKDKVSGHETNI